MWVTGPTLVSTWCVEYALGQISLTLYTVAPDVWLAGGAEYFSGNKSLNQNNYLNSFKKAGYNVVLNKKDLLANKKKQDKLLGVFRQGNLDVYVWHVSKPKSCY